MPEILLHHLIYLPHFLGQQACLQAVSWYLSHKYLTTSRRGEPFQNHVGVHNTSGHSAALYCSWCSSLARSVHPLSSQARFGSSITQGCVIVLHMQSTHDEVHMRQCLDNNTTITQGSITPLAILMHCTTVGAAH